MTGQMQPVVCPVCRTKQDGFAPIASEADTPEPGSMLVCFYCTTVSELQEDWTLRALDGKELTALLAEDPSLEQAIMAVRLLRILTAGDE
jgi:hypothetical protein